jgi:hypothetical protein
LGLYVGYMTRTLSIFCTMVKHVFSDMSAYVKRKPFLKACFETFIPFVIGISLINFVGWIAFVICGWTGVSPSEVLIMLGAKNKDPATWFDMGSVALMAVLFILFISLIVWALFITIEKWVSERYHRALKEIDDDKS